LKHVEKRLDELEKVELPTTQEKNEIAALRKDPFSTKPHIEHYHLLSRMFTNLTVDFKKNRYAVLYPYSRISLLPTQSWQCLTAANKHLTKNKGKLKKKKTAKGKAEANAKVEISTSIMADLVTNLSEEHRVAILKRVIEGEVKLNHLKKHIKLVKGIAGAMRLVTALYNESRPGEADLTFEQIRAKPELRLKDATIQAMGAKLSTSKSHHPSFIGGESYMKKKQNKRLQFLADLIDLQPTDLQRYYKAVVYGGEKKKGEKEELLSWKHPVHGDLYYQFYKGDPHTETKISANGYFKIPNRPFTACMFSPAYGLGKYAPFDSEFKDEEPTGEDEIESIMRHAIDHTTSGHMTFLIWHRWEEVHTAYSAIKKVCGDDKCENFVWCKANPFWHQGLAIPNDQDFAGVGYYNKVSDKRHSQCFTKAKGERSSRRCFRGVNLNKAKVLLNGKQEVLNAAQMNPAVEYEWLKAHCMPGDWVLAPCSGAGSSVMSALVYGCNVIAYDKRDSQVNHAPMCVQAFLSKGMKRCNDEKAGTFDAECFFLKDQDKKFHTASSSSSASSSASLSLSLSSSSSSSSS
jgi:hypothetical protein